MRKRVLLIGAGKRMLDGIIPALLCLEDTFTIVHVLTRSEKTLSVLGGRFRATTITVLDTVDFSHLDLIIMAVPKVEVPAVLERLSRFTTAHIRLFLDTPVLPLKKISCLKYFRRFQRVFAAEDSIALPPYVLAKKIIAEGKIGTLRHIILDRSGYRYHALATLKFLSSAPYIPFLRYRKKPDGAWTLGAWLPNGVTATVIGPRDYSVGRFLIEGSTGAIADFDAARPNLWRIEYADANGVYRGLTLNGNRLPPSDRDVRYQNTITNAVIGATGMHALKVRALVDMLADSFMDPSSHQYAATAGVYDYGAITMAERFGFFIDPSVLHRTLNLVNVRYRTL